MNWNTKQIHRLYAIVGRDGFLRGEALESILGQLSGSGGAISAARFDGEMAELADVLDEVRTPSLLGESRVAVVESADVFITAHRRPLERYCQSPSPCGCLIFLCQSLPKNTNLYKIIEKSGEVIVCEPPRSDGLLRWISQRAEKVYGKEIDSEAVRRLHDHLGDSPGWLDAELGKLSAYVGQRSKITEGDIEDLTGQLREEKVFAVIDAMAMGDTAAALRQWEQVLATDRAAPGRAIGGLAWAVRSLHEARGEWERGASLQAVNARVRTDPKLLRQRLERNTTRSLRAMLRDLLAADFAIKTGASTVDMAVEKFIVTHSTEAGMKKARSVG